MGGRIIALAAASTSAIPAGALEAAGHPSVGKDAGLTAGCGELGIPITFEIQKAFANAKVLIDFSAPSATVRHSEAAAERGLGVVIGTTGLSDADLKSLAEVARHVPLIVAPNMSLGVNLLCRIAPQIVKALGSAYDIEIIESHHNKKKDAPSGTALRLLDVILDARNATRTDAVWGREGRETARREGEIGVHAVRGGDIVGDHTILFAGQGERIELTHRASSRDTFALGALRAAVFIAGKPPGQYTMEDVLL